jgi:hypothetical protein
MMLSKDDIFTKLVVLFHKCKVEYNALKIVYNQLYRGHNWKKNNNSTLKCVKDIHFETNCFC